MSLSTSLSSADLLVELFDLLQSFEQETKGNELRRKVQALVPIHDMLVALGRSLIPPEIAASARGRLLHYFQKYPLTALPRKELQIVAGIDEWARRVRELRVEHGWAIITGQTAKQMYADGEFPLPDVDIASMHKDDYILISIDQDRDAAHRWHLAKDIRNRQSSVRENLIEYLRANVGVPVTGEELRYVAKDKTEWARRVRELRTEFGWPITTKSSGRPDLPVGVYLLEQDRQSPVHDRQIMDNVRRAVLRRDNYTCSRCGWTHRLWNRSDPRHLELHHIEAHVEGGENTTDNLITLCTVCHDFWHSIEKDEEPMVFAAWLSS